MTSHKSLNPFEEDEFELTDDNLSSLKPTTAVSQYLKNKSQREENFSSFKISQKELLPDNHLDSKKDYISAGPGDLTRPKSDIYRLNHFADWWFYLTLASHFLLFGILLGVGYPAIDSLSLTVLLIVVIAVPVLLIIARCIIKKTPRITNFKSARTVEDESDYVPNKAIFILAAASIQEGLAFAVYPAASASHAVEKLNSTGFYSFETMVQTLRFASVALYGFHRLLRPANRLDPMRTILELEIVAVCWDTIDGSTLYELIGKSTLPSKYDSAARVLMIFWYASVGVRLAMMCVAHMSAETSVYKAILSAPLSLSTIPLVDRSLQALRFRSVITTVMAVAEFYAGGLRIALWSEGLLDIVQQEMMIKNILFVVSVGSAYSTYSTTAKRAWNERNLFLCINKPPRIVQKETIRWTFAFSFILTSALLTSYVLKGDRTGGNKLWVVNVMVDFVLMIFFLVYCRNVHKQKKWIVFPGRLGAVLGVLFAFSLYAARLPALYRLRQVNESVHDDWSYDNALFVVSASVVPMALYTLYWSMSYLLFYPEYSACPGKYHAVHDPIIGVVSISYMVEGALDILSCTALMSLAAYSLPLSVHGAIVLCVLLEVANACQCFSLDSLLAGVLDDTAAQLVTWKARLRGSRMIIDFIVFVLRIVLWAQYDAVSSVFLVKNIYNLLHGVSMVERATGVSCYPSNTMFMGFVAPQDWYDMTDEQWREATAQERGTL